MKSIVNSIAVCFFVWLFIAMGLWPVAIFGLFMWGVISTIAWWNKPPEGTYSSDWLACPACKQRRNPEDKFCAYCGSDFEGPGI